MKKVSRARQAARPPPPHTGTKFAGTPPHQQDGYSEQAAAIFTPDNLLNILNSSGVPTLVLDRNLKLRFFTSSATALYKITGADLGRALSNIPRRFVDDDLFLDAKTVVATGVSLWREIETDRGASYNRRLLPYRTEDNAIQGVVVTFADISEVKAVEREIEVARAYSNSIIDTIRQPLVVLDHEMRIVSASPSFYRSFAIRPENAVGQQLPNLRDHCLDVPALRSFLDGIAGGHEASDDCEIEIDLPPRGRRVLLLNAHKISAVASAKQRTLLAIDDITNRKHAEEALEAAKRQAERANLGKSRFLAAASHDLRQPLQTIFLMQGILATTVKDPEAIKLVTRVGESLDVMSGMLNKLLDINQLEAGIVKPEIENFAINDLLERLRTDVSYQADGKWLSCRVVSSGHAVRSDPALLEQILRNLVSNALKYTTHGKVLLGCRRRRNALRIEVWDTGQGIPEGQLRAVFEEFHQLDNPARARARGLGLGLAIVQRLADLLGHKVDVRSWPGKGSVFAIEVPCVDAAPAALTQPAPKSAERAPAANASILIVEDDPGIRETLQLLFELRGYTTSVASDGQDALALVARKAMRPDIVIADYNLPNGPNGLEVAYSLRKTFGNALPILIATGDIATETLRAISGANCIHLHKPIKAEELMQLVRSQLSASPHATDRAPRPPAEIGPDELAPTVFVIDDDDALRDTIRLLLEQEGRLVETFASGEAFLEAYRAGRKGCLLVDARLPGLGGLALLQRLKDEHHTLPSIMITGHGEVSMAVEAMKAGAIDFIEKPVRTGELLVGIERALALSHDSSALSSWHDDAATRIAQLTPRERQVMERVIAGQPNKIIAADLKLSQRTVENHRAAVMRKTHSKSLSDLVRLSIAAA